MRRCYFETDGGGFLPTEVAQSPWDRDVMSGVALGGLLAHLLDGAIGGASLTVARLTIDILGAAPRRRTEGRVTVRRDGRRLRLIEIELLVAGRAVARASALLARTTQSPPAATDLAWPPPEEIAPAAPSGSVLKTLIERRMVRGSPREPGPGAMWVWIDAEMVGGVPLSPLCRAAMMGDMGSAIGSSLDVRNWTFPNLDVALHFTRMPQGEWLLIDSVSESAGNGLSLVSSVFADRGGVYARGHQTLFVEPRQSGNRGK